MQKNSSRVTVFFDDPFWVAVYERWGQNRLEACKIPFGAEPSDGQVYEFLLANWHRLRFSPAIGVEGPEREAPKNPKRRQREIQRQTAKTGVGTKAQQALKLRQENGKEARKQNSREQQQRQQEEKYRQKQEKRKQKHRGH